MDKFHLPYEVYKPYNSDCSYFITLADDSMSIRETNNVVEILDDKEYMFIQIRLYNAKNRRFETIVKEIFGYVGAGSVSGIYIPMNEAYKKLMRKAEKYFNSDAKSYKANIGFEGGTLGEILGENNGIFYIDYHKGYLRIGTLCNSGMITDAEYKYDSCFSLDENIQSAVERFIEYR